MLMANQKLGLNIFYFKDERVLGKAKLLHETYPKSEYQKIKIRYLDQASVLGCVKPLIGKKTQITQLSI